jgi:hypothetical protein
MLAERIASTASRRRRFPRGARLPLPASAASRYSHATTTNQSEASTALNSGASPRSGKRLGSMPSETASVHCSRISRAISSWPVARQRPRSAMKVSRPQSVNQG